jgi:hypothetical protein
LIERALGEGEEGGEEGGEEARQESGKEEGGTAWIAM